MMYGYIKIGSAVPVVKVSDCEYNKNQIISLIKRANDKGIRILNFPELCITSYSCMDLFFQTSLYKHAVKSLKEILDKTLNIKMLISLGMPIIVDGNLYNCAVMIFMGKIMAIIPKTAIPNNNEFFEKRYFSSSQELVKKEIYICGQTVPIGTDILLRSKCFEELVVGVEICADMWSPIPPSSYKALFGANVILNLSASTELTNKNSMRKNVMSNISSRLNCAYIYASAGFGESTQDSVFGGYSAIFENGTCLSEGDRFKLESSLIYADVDIELLNHFRINNTNFSQNAKEISKVYNFRTVYFDLEESAKTPDIGRSINKFPFLPKSNEKDFFEDILNIQTNGLIKRLLHINCEKVILGISGGLDSTLALIVSVMTFDKLKIDRKNIIGVTMPCFGTSSRTYKNAVKLMSLFGIHGMEIPIKDSILQHFKDINHDINDMDITYENAQARERTQILMDLANKYNGIVIGTGDMSEVAQGFATYNGDIMSMYGVNSGVPKTLIRALITFLTENYFDSEISDILKDIVNTPVSPELLPPDDNGEISQSTEKTIGPYELSDFFLYNMMMYGYSSEKILFLAEKAFKDDYKKDDIKKWLNSFMKRFFDSQFKRSCLPDGMKVTSVGLSQRGDLKMASDVCKSAWTLTDKD